MAWRETATSLVLACLAAQPGLYAGAGEPDSEDEAFERLVETVISGGTGNWGDDYMSPDRRVPEEDIRALVRWLLALE